MIVRFNEKNMMRSMRLKLYQDPVFLIAHEAIKPLLRLLDLTELFASAELFVHHLTKFEITDESLMSYEVEDVREEFSELNAPDASAPLIDFQLFLAVSFIKLCAMRKKSATAAHTARTLLGYCDEYEGFGKLISSMDSKEASLRAQHTLPSLLEYELRTLSEERISLEETKRFVHAFVDNCMALTPESIERILTPLMTTNEQYGNAFSEEVNRLKEKLGMKTTPVAQTLVQGDLVGEKHVQYEMNGIENGGNGVIIEKMPQDKVNQQNYQQTNQQRKESQENE